MSAQNHGGVDRTDDGGGSWISIAEGLPSDFGFMALAAHPRHRLGGAVKADRARLLEVGQLRDRHSRDARRTWTALGDGLRFVECLSVCLPVARRVARR